MDSIKFAIYERHGYRLRNVHGSLGRHATKSSHYSYEQVLGLLSIYCRALLHAPMKIFAHFVLKEKWWTRFWTQVHILILYFYLSIIFNIISRIIQDICFFLSSSMFWMSIRGFSSCCYFILLLICEITSVPMWFQVQINCF